MDRIIDLHTHSTASDGTDSPEELIIKAKQAGLSAIALTDHDNFNGLERAQKKANELDIELIKGIELSCTHTKDEVHILGYWLEKANEEYANSEALQKISLRLKAFRDQRNETLFSKLHKAGIPLELEDVLDVLNSLDSKQESKSDKHEDYFLCRPHFALAMVQKGYVKDIKTAFAKYLGIKGLAFVAKEKLSQQEAINVLLDAKAMVVLAHPFLIATGNEPERKSLIKQLKDYGLQGIETYYSMNNKVETAKTLAYAREFDLAITGGSDYHGAVKPHISLGKGTGNLRIPYSILDDLRARNIA